MKQIGILIAMLFVLGTIGCGTANHPPSPVAVDAELQRLESAKWHPSSLGSPEQLLALFADDFVTVEYGADVHGGVERKLNAKTSMSGPEGARFFQLLDQTHFELSDWRFIHIDSVGVVVSYHVSAPSLGWNAYATSVWQNEEIDGRQFSIKHPPRNRVAGARALARPRPRFRATVERLFDAAARHRPRPV